MSIINQYMEPFFSFINQQKDYDLLIDTANKRKHIMKDYYDREMNEAQTAFNRSYYRNYLDNANARNMLKRVQQQLKDQSNAARNRIAVTGGTPEALAAMQKNNNRTLDSVIGTLAQTDAAAKERAENRYEARKQDLNNFRLGYTLDSFNQLEALKREKGIAIDSYKKDMSMKFANGLFSMIGL